MRRRAKIITISLALMFGLSAAILADKWLEEQAKNVKTVVVTEPSPIRLSSVVVAKAQLQYGMELTRKNLKEIPWPEDTLPEGSFFKIDDLITGDKKRSVLRRMDVNEPILTWKITGSGQRASLSAMLKKGMKAVTIRVNDVYGVGGFVLPGTSVDVLLTRTVELKRDAAEDDAKPRVTDAFTDVLLQNIRVLAVDQLTDDSRDKPAVARTVTVEVDIIDAQKLALAATVGSLSLVLRETDAQQSQLSDRITISDLERGLNQQTIKVQNKKIAKVEENGEPEKSGIKKVAPGQSRKSTTMVSVVRAMNKSEYRVVEEVR